MTARSKGQAVVEFAFVAPMLVILTLTTIYVGIAFMDYSQYNNAARAAARDISLTDGFSDKKKLVNDINAQKKTLLKRYATQLTSFFTPTWSAVFLDKEGNKTTDKTEAYDVQVSIDLERESFSDVLENLHFLPKNFPIVFTMRLENM